MKNKHVGMLLLGIAILIVGIIFMFENALTSFVDASCTLAHGDGVCPMYDTIDTQTNLSLGIVGILIIVALVLIFSKPEERVIIKTKTVERKQAKVKRDTSELKPEEKTVLHIIETDKTVFQADIIEKTGFGKARITRILDRLEGKGFVERKRRGMTNIVILTE